MQNIILYILETLVVFGALTLISHFFGRIGVICWIPLVTVIANILTVKTFSLGVLDITGGTVLFASTFLATDVLTERCSKSDATLGVRLGFICNACLLAFTAIELKFIPNEFDISQDSLQVVLSTSFRITASSMIMYLIANLSDVYVYSYLRDRKNKQGMWARSMFATIVCNCAENFLFMFGAFLFIYDFRTILLMATTTSIVEVVLGIVDIPFLYLATKYFKEESDND